LRDEGLLNDNENQARVGGEVEPGDLSLMTLDGFGQNLGDLEVSLSVVELVSNGGTAKKKDIHASPN